MTLTEFVSMETNGGP